MEDKKCESICICGCQEDKECICNENKCSCGCEEGNCTCDEKCTCGCKENNSKCKCSEK